MTRLLRRFVRDQNGATVIEYALIAVLISLVVISAGSLIGKTLGNDFNNADNGLTGSAS